MTTEPNRPFGDAALLQQARDLCRAIESLPAGAHQTELSGRAADIAHALQQLQATGDHFWPRPAAPQPEPIDAQNLVLADPHDDVEKTVAVVRAAYDWMIDDDGRLHGLVAGDMGYAPTHIVIAAENRPDAPQPEPKELTDPEPGALYAAGYEDGERDANEQLEQLIRGLREENERLKREVYLAQTEAALLRCKCDGAFERAERAEAALAEERERVIKAADTEPRDGTFGTTIVGGRRCAIACDDDDWASEGAWWVGISPRNGYGALVEGPWGDWVELAKNILSEDARRRSRTHDSTEKSNDD